MEKQEFWFINNITHPLPDPPPLCGGGDSNGKHALKPHTVAVSVV